MSGIKYCALTTVSISMIKFVLPAMESLYKHGYNISIACKADNDFAGILPRYFRYIPLDIDRGFKLYKTLKTIFCLYIIFRKEKFDMIEYGTENVSFCAAIAGWIAGIPVRIYNHWGARYIGYEGFERIISIWIERIAAYFSTDIRQQSLKNMHQCINDKIYSAEKVKVLGRGGTVGVDFKQFDKFKKLEYRENIRLKYSIPMDGFVFGDVGSIRKDKGTNELIRAFKELLNKYTNIYLILVGDMFQDDKPEEELLDWASTNKHIIFPGRVNDVERYVAAFDCITHPSYREGLGMVLQEAGAMGVPYIASDIPGPSEFGVNGNTGLLMIKGNWIDLMEKMEWVLTHREEYLQMSKNVYELVKHNFERSIMINQILNDRNCLYKNFMGNK